MNIGAFIRETPSKFDAGLTNLVSCGLVASISSSLLDILNNETHKINLQKTKYS